MFFENWRSYREIYQREPVRISVVYGKAKLIDRAVLSSFAQLL